MGAAQIIHLSEAEAKARRRLVTWVYVRAECPYALSTFSCTTMPL